MQKSQSKKFKSELHPNDIGISPSKTGSNVTLKYSQVFQAENHVILQLEDFLSLERVPLNCPFYNPRYFSYISAQCLKLKWYLIKHFKP